MVILSFLNRISRDYYRIDHNMSAKYWNLESGYAPGIQLRDPLTYPFRDLTAGTSMGIQFNLRIDLGNMIGCADEQEDTYKILLHMPAEVPLSTLKGNYIIIRNTSEVELSIIPNVMISSEGIRNYEPTRLTSFYYL